MNVIQVARVVPGAQVDRVATGIRRVAIDAEPGWTPTHVTLTVDDVASLLNTFSIDDLDKLAEQLRYYTAKPLIDALERK